MIYYDFIVQCFLLPQLMSTIFPYLSFQLP